MPSSLKVILLLVACAGLIHAHDDGDHTCNHDEMQELNPVGFMDINEDFSSLDSGRVLAAEDYPNLRIHANYDALAKSASSSYTAYIKNDLAPAVISYLQSALRVKYPVSGKFVISSSVKSLCDITTPAELKSGVDADYVILFSIKSGSSGSILATSYNCQVASGTKRPLVGHTSLSTGGVKEPKGDVTTHEKNTYLLLHEIMHTLGFSKSLHKYFIDASGKTLSGHVKSAKINGETLPVIDIPSLTQRLRDFHGCSTLPGAIMASGDASHWNKKIYLYETMQSGAVDGKRASELSLAFLEASGWYTADYTKAEPYFYAQGQGCDFINTGCSSSSSKASFDEFCTGSSGRGCGFIGNSAGSCGSGSHMGSCKYVIPSSSYSCEDPDAAGNAKLSSVESYGREEFSRCFTGTLATKKSSSTNAYCFKFNCVGEGASTQLEVLLGSKKAICSREGTATVDGYYGAINCPDPLTFCNTVGKRHCPRACMGRGTCVDYKCQCDSGFKGVDCGLKA